MKDLEDAVMMTMRTFKHEAEEVLNIQGLQKYANGIDKLEHLDELRKKMAEVPLASSDDSECTWIS